MFRILATLFVLLSIVSQTALGQSNRTFTYQGILREAGALSTGSSDFRVQAYTSAGSPLGGPIFINDVTVSNGVFALAIDPSLVPALDASLGNIPVALEIAVATSTSSGPSVSYTTLSPRQLVTSAPIAGSVIDGAVSASKVNASEVQLRISGGCSAGQFVQQVNQDGSVVCAAGSSSGSGWSLSGNAATDPASTFLGTTDAQPLVLRTQNARSLRIEPSAEQFAGLPSTVNWIAGSYANTILNGVRGATISGGGAPVGDSDPDFGSEAPNRVRDHYGTVSGGMNNIAGGGTISPSDRPYAFVGGGSSNIANGILSAIVGGELNNSLGANSTIGGGYANSARGIASAIPGGIQNVASGDRSLVFGDNSCAGGADSIALGNRAKVRPAGDPADSSACAGLPSYSGSADSGSFVFADSSETAPFISSGPNQFLLRAAGGMAVNSNDPAGNALRVNGLTRVDTLGAAGATALCRNADNQIASCAGGGASGWGLVGNADTDSAQNFIGTTDDEPLELRTQNARSLRIEPSAEQFAGLPSTVNWIAGSHANNVAAGVRGATIGGGGLPLGNSDPNFASEAPNSVVDAYGTVSGGAGNRAGDGMGSAIDRPFATVGGGLGNFASGEYASVLGGQLNQATGAESTIGGGRNHRASGVFATIAGGQSNVASGRESFAGSGFFNCAGGTSSVALGSRALVRPGVKPNDGLACDQAPSYPGGDFGDSGTFVWADLQLSHFASTGPNQFLVRAAGGMAVNSNDPAGNALRVNGTLRVDTLGSAGTASVCRNAANQLSQCSSSARYKHAIQDLALGLAAVSQLRPVAFNWNGSNEADIGFVAEEVAKLDKRLVNFNAAGQIEGVKYDRLSAVLAGAVQELGARNSLIEAQLLRLEDRLRALEAR